jgi:tetratricopeptide (TPR) repeat protein
VHAGSFSDPAPAERKEAAAGGSIDPQPFTVKVRLLAEGKELVFLIRLEREGVVTTDGELRGDPGQVAEWLTDLAVIIERAAFPAREPPVAWDALTTSTDALRRFLEAGGSPDFEEKTRLLREALAADPSFLEARWQLGVVLYALGGYEDALDALETYLAARPSSSRAAHNSAAGPGRRLRRLPLCLDTFRGS